MRDSPGSARFPHLTLWDGRRGNLQATQKSLSLLQFIWQLERVLNNLNTSCKVIPQASACRLVKLLCCAAGLRRVNGNTACASRNGPPLLELCSAEALLSTAFAGELVVLTSPAEASTFLTGVSFLQIKLKTNKHANL